ncbi:hypothetical protein ACFVQB_21570 [Paenibacillus sp. NPDC057886]|uniref:hypothetical protein n=1 Tax=Paenibacillus sp. NPDC057886 TaxID=3346270 RepID=UPI0036CC01FF
MELKKRSVRLYPRIFPFEKGNQKNLGITAIESPIHPRSGHPNYRAPIQKIRRFCKRSEGDGIGTVEAKRSPLSPNFDLLNNKSKKLGDNSDRKSNPSPKRSPLHQSYLLNQ